jgi:hypothetical protein
MPTERGIQMRDIVHYRLPGGVIGRLLHPWLIRPRLEEIFDYRKHRITELFGTSPASTPTFQTSSITHLTGGIASNGHP